MQCLPLLVWDFNVGADVTEDIVDASTFASGLFGSCVEVTRRGLFSSREILIDVDVNITGWLFDTIGFD